MCLEDESLRIANEAQKQKLLQEAEAAKQSERENAIEFQRHALQIKEQQILLKERQVALGEKLLELEKKRYDLALETAVQLIDVLQPGVNSQTKAMAARTLLPNLLHLSNGKGLDLTLLPAATSREEPTTSAEQPPK
jgi:hypothetical protein